MSQSTRVTGDTAGLRASLRSPDVRQRQRDLAERLASQADPEAELEAAYLAYMTHDFEGARVHAQAAYSQFRHVGLKRRAATAAAVTGRVYFEGLNNHAAARGWFARGRTLLVGEGDCLERGWVELGLVGCSVTDVSALAVAAADALELARRFDDLDLECKALADLGLALVSLGRIEEGIERVDEAMAIVSTGEVHDFAAGQVACCTLTACERAGDLARADAWLQALEEAGMTGTGGRVSTVFAHCHATYGSLLCQVGRWDAAEAALTVGLTEARGGFYLHRVMARASLAELRIRQGRLEEAAQLLAHCPDRWEAIPARARLLHARGDLDNAISSLKQALRQIGDDHVRAVPLLALMVDAELGRGDLEGAATAARRAEQLARESGSALRLAEAALANGRVLAQQDRVEAAAAALAEGLRTITPTNHLLVKADLHLELSRTLSRLDPSSAIPDARAALAVFERLDAPEAEVCVSLLNRLGVAIGYRRRPPADPLAELSKREREVVRLVGLGMSNPEIADKLFLSPRTVEHHVSSILSKLGLRSRIQVSAVQQGLDETASSAAGPPWLSE